MSDPVYHLLGAVAFIFVIEGLLYALFPDKVKSLMAMALATPSQTLRRAGAVAALFGAAAGWLLQQLH